MLEYARRPVGTLSWIALVAALVLIVPAAIRIVTVLMPRGGDVEATQPGRALDAVWTVAPFVLLAALVAFSVAAA